MARAVRRAVVVAFSALLAFLAPTRAVTASACTPGPGVQRTYTYVEIGVFGTASADGRGVSAAWAVNMAGQVVGASTTNVFGAGRAFLWQNGQMTDLGVVGGGTYASSAAYGINDFGDVVGQTHVNSTSPPHAFLYRNGVMTDLGTGYRGGGAFSRGWDISNTGRIVGERARQQSSAVRAYLLENARFVDLGTLGGTGTTYGTSSIAYGINDQKQIVGTALPASGPLHAFLWDTGVMSDLGTLGGNSEATEARAINNAGQVVGSSQTATGATHAFWWKDGVMCDLGTLGGQSSYAFGINAQGQIVGGSRTAASPQYNAGRAFLWENGQLIDLNTRVTNLPTTVILEIARAISDNGTIVGTTCSGFCEPGKTAPTRGFVLIPN